MTAGPLGDGGEVDLAPTGVVQHVQQTRLQQGRRRFDEALRVAELGGDHVWTVLVTHLIADPRELLGAAGEPHLDAESLVGIHVGCYRCEQPLDQAGRIIRRRCPGEPR